MEFPLVGEPLVLDLVNTWPNTRDGPVDLLSTVEQLRSWLEVEGDRVISPDPGETVDDSVLAAVRAVRAHSADALVAVRHGDQPSLASLRGLTDALSAAPAYRVLALHVDRVTAERRRTGPYGTRLAAELADSAAELLTDGPALAAVRQCAAEDCVMLFRPVHPRRIWCSASRCGNRARVSRYYRRHKQN